MRQRSAAVGAALALGLLIGTAPAVASESRIVTLAGTVTYLVVEAGAGEAASEELETISAVTVDGVPVPVPDALVADLVSGDPVEVAVEAPAGLDESELAAALTDPTSRADVVDVSALETRPADVTAAVTTGVHQLTIVPVRFDAASPPSTSQLAGLAADAAAYWERQSGGRLAFAGPEVLAPRTVATPAGCTAQTMSELYASATAGVAASSDTRHVVVYFPGVLGCPWAGLASVGGGQVWVNGSTLPDVLPHELGHNFRLGHANLITCSVGGVRVSLAFAPDGTCAVEEYGDWADVMGIALAGAPPPPTGSLNVAMADALGFATVADTATVGASVDLAPISAPGGLRGLRTAVPDGFVYAEYRPAVAADERLALVSRLRSWPGVQLRLARWDPSGALNTYLLDLQPGLGPFVAPALPVGASTRIASTAVTLTTLATGATARVGVGDRVERYIGAVYRDLFGREVDATGLAAWRSELASGTPRIAVANAITGSAEFRSGLIRQSYTTYLGRSAEPAGLASWLLEMGAGVTQERMEAGFLASDEYYAQSGQDDSSWVRRLYRHVLGREAAEAEVQDWVGALRSGRGRYGVALGFLLSTEHLATVVDGHYMRLLGRHLDPSGLATWVGALQGGARIEGVVGGIVASDEYFQRL